jgi:hypothetical protein
MSPGSTSAEIARRAHLVNAAHRRAIRSVSLCAARAAMDILAGALNALGTIAAYLLIAVVLEFFASVQRAARPNQ